MEQYRIIIHLSAAARFVRLRVTTNYSHSIKAKFHYAIMVADRSEAAGRRPAASWNLAYHLAR